MSDRQDEQLIGKILFKHYKLKKKEMNFNSIIEYSKESEYELNFIRNGDEIRNSYICKLISKKILTNEKEKLDHPNIIKFKEVFIANKPIKTLNIVTEYADGGDLSLEIKNQRKEYFKESQILDYFTQICLAIKHIHGKHIMHRDLKSQNIF